MSRLLLGGPQRLIATFFILVLASTPVTGDPRSAPTEELRADEPMQHTLCADEQARLVREVFRAADWGWLRIYQDADRGIYVSWEFAETVAIEDSSMRTTDFKPNSDPEDQIRHEAVFDDRFGYCHSVGSHDPEFWIQVYIVSGDGSLPIQTQARSLCVDTYVFFPQCLWVYRSPLSSLINTNGDG